MRDGCRGCWSLGFGRISDRILVEAAQLAALVEVLRHDQAAALAEFLEARSREAGCGERGAGRLVEMRQPMACGLR